jgi:hypothetical protein
MTGEPRRLDRAARHVVECGARDEVHVRIEREGKHGRRAAQRADFGKPVLARRPAGELAERALYRPGELQPVGVGIRHHVGGHRERQHQRPFQDVAPGKPVDGHEPGAEHAHGDDAQRHREHEKDGIPHVRRQRGGGEMRPGFAPAAEHARHDEEHRQREQRAGHERHPSQETQSLQTIMIIIDKCF